MNELSDEMRRVDQRLASLEQGARQLRLAKDRTDHLDQFWREIRASRSPLQGRLGREQHCGAKVVSSHSWRCAHQQLPVAYSPPAKPLQRRGSPFISRVFGSAQPKRRILRGRQFNTPCTTAVSGGTSFLLPPSGGLYKQNQGKLWYSIQAVLKVVSAPVCL